MRQLSTRLYNLWQLTRSSLLYAPALFCAAFVLVGVGLFQLDHHFDDVFSDRRFIYNGNTEEASDVIGLLLTSMVTMTTLAISITMVVLSLAASQLGPRLVRVFMSDRRTKVYIGIFFGTIVLCFTTLGILHDPIAGDSTPRLLVSATFVVCFLNLFILLAYVDHVARSSVADNIIARLTRELMESIERLAPARDETLQPNTPSGAGQFPDLTTHGREELRCNKSGYIQSIGYDDLVKLAEEHDAYISLCSKPGDFVVEGQCIGCVYSPAAADTAHLASRIIQAILLGQYRSATQDIEYSIRHMVEIALRALSPSVNDSFTGVTVLDKLTSVLVFLFRRALPNHSFKNDEGRLRVMGQAVDEAALIYKALSDIRNAGQQQPIILESLICNIATLLKLATSDAATFALSLQIEHIKQHIAEHFSGSLTEVHLQQCLRDNGFTA